jgi:hypothetical protein
MDEVMVDNHYDGEVELPQREEDDEPVPTREGGIFLRTSDRLVMLEDIIRYDEVN